jgi:hypothetical protein
MQLLQERAKTHGDYGQTAQTAQVLKRLIRHAPAYADMSERQKESLEMIATKLARIMCGNPHEPDHWKDIAGYALLAVKGTDDANA